MEISNRLTVIRFLNIDINAILTLSQYVNDALIGKLTLLNRDLRGVLTKSPPHYREFISILERVS